MQFYLLASTIGLLGCCGALRTAGTEAAVVYNYPAHWYRFENASNLGQDYADSVLSGTEREDIEIPEQDLFFNESHGGVLGGYLACTFNCSLGLTLPPGQAIEFIFRTNSTGHFLVGPGELKYGKAWELNYPWNETAYQQDLDGTGAQSMNYVQNGEWHTLAVSRNSSGGVLFCLDGIYCGGMESNNSQSFAHWAWSLVPETITREEQKPNTFFLGFAVDEIAIYKDQLTAESMYAHYVQVMQDHQEYQFNVPTPKEMPIPEPTYPPQEYNPLEYPPGANLSSGNPTQGVTLSALKQLAQFPDPEYPTDGTLDLFERNFDWLAPEYMGGQGQPGVSAAAVLNNSLAIQELLYKKYHYGVVFDNLISCCSEETEKMIESFSTYTDKVDVIIMRLETAGGTVLYNHTLPDGCYLQNDQGYLNVNGDLVTKAKAHLRLLGSEASMAAAGCPYSTFYHDGLMFNESLSHLQTVLNQKGMKFDRINNDGEAITIIRAPAALKDPMVKRDYEASGAANWLTYWSEWRRRMSNPTFRDLFMGGSGPNAERGNATGRFTQYQIQGTNRWFGNWSVTREIMQPLKNNQYYSCADFYPKKPSTVFTYQVACWHGIGWMKEVRASEIAAGNPWFSPFVAAGWSGASEENIRPAQWLGLLKIFGAWGAEFYYGGFFSLSAPFPIPANWIWQAAMPSYAQAITVHYADIFFNGTFVGWVDTGYTNVFCVVRKSNTQAQYIITLTVQAMSNWEGNAPKQIEGMKIGIPGTSLVVEGLTARRQGSVYRYTVVENDSPKIEWLDEWHEGTHPIYWQGKSAFYKARENEKKL